TSQYAIRYRVEGAGPWEAAMVAKLPVRYRIMKRLTHDRFHPPGHLERGATGERQQQDTLGAYTLDDEVRDPMGERHCLAGAGAGNDQKRPGTEGNTGCVSIGGRLALGLVQRLQVARPRLCGNVHPGYSGKCVFLSSTG